METFKALTKQEGTNIYFDADKTVVLFCRRQEKKHIIFSIPKNVWHFLFCQGFSKLKQHIHCTEVRFASFLSGGFTTMAVMNLDKRTSVHCCS